MILLFEDFNEAENLWKELYNEFFEKYVIPSKKDEDEYCLNNEYKQNSDLDQTLKRSNYILNALVSFFDEKGFLYDKGIKNSITWMNLNFNRETNFKIAFSRWKNYFQKKYPYDILISQKNRTTFSKTGVFEKVNSFEEIDFKKLNKLYKDALDKFMREMELDSTISSFDFVDILVEIFKKEIGEDLDWEKVYEAIQDDDHLYDSDNFFDDLFHFITVYLEDRPFFFNRKLDDINDKTGVFD